VQPSTRSALTARLAVTVAAVLPYWPLLGLDRIHIPDDGFTSDLYNGELPARVLLGKLVASGQAPVWSSEACSGFPIGAGGVGEPLGTFGFALLPPVLALDVLLLILLLVAAHGAYGLARRLGASLPGAVLAGATYAGSGYFVTQLRHLSVLATVAWLPLGLLLLDGALAARSPRAALGEAGEAEPSAAGRWLRLGLFGLVFGEQALSGFPQSAYISALVYIAWASTLLLGGRGRTGGWPAALKLGLGTCGALGLGAALGAVALLPLAELGSLSDRSGDMGWQFASMLPYSWRDALNFLVPYINGDAADDSYVGATVFWEVYGYVGLATVLLALWAVARGYRRPRVGLLVAMALLAFLMVLGVNTPVYRWVWEYVPGMGRFRLPTRFLVVVELALALLGGVGLTVLGTDLQRWLSARAPRAANWLVMAVVAGTVADLFIQQSHQNPFVSGTDWLTPPESVARLQREGRPLRTYSPWHDQFHRLARSAARGWQELWPYWGLRDSLAPNLGLYWGVPSADCYAGISPRWHVALWGDHMRPGLVSRLSRMGPGRLETAKSFVQVLSTFGVTHVLSPVEIEHPRLTATGDSGTARIYAVPGERARVVSAAKAVTSDEEAAAGLLSSLFEPSSVVLLDSPPADLPHLLPAGSTPPAPSRGTARIVAETTRSLSLEVTAPEGGFLFLADTWYPGWSASVDGRPATLFRANLSGRAVLLPAGARQVQFHYAATPFFRGLRVTLGALGALGLWVGAAAWSERRKRRSA